VGEGLWQLLPKKVDTKLKKKSTYTLMAQEDIYGDFGLFARGSKIHKAWYLWRHFTVALPNKRM